MGKKAVLGAGVLAAILAGGAAAATPVQGSISGPVTAVKGKTFAIKTSLSPTGSSKISIVKATRITEQATGTAKSVKKGLCVTAMGTKNKKGVVTAQRVSLRSPVKGSCTGGFGNGTRPNGTGTRPRPPGSGSGQQPGGTAPGGGFRNNADFGFASGTVTSIKGTTMKVEGHSFTGTGTAKTTTTTVRLVKKTRIDRTLTVGAKAVKKKLCAFVFGTSTDKGVSVKAQSVALTKPTANGCTFGFRGRPGGGTSSSGQNP